MKKSTVKSAEVTEGAPSGAPTEERLLDGQYKDHYVLSDDERKVSEKVRPVRASYKHEVCGSVTTMPIKCAETYAVNPSFYGSTFCCICGDYFPVGEHGKFVWLDDNTKVGT
jgi:hypothetical protein